MLPKLFHSVQAAFAKDFTVAALRALIIGVAVLWSVIALFVENKWVLGGIAAYLILP